MYCYTTTAPIKISSCPSDITVAISMHGRAENRTPSDKLMIGVLNERHFQGVILH